MTSHQHTGRIIEVRTGRILECRECGQLVPLYCGLCNDPAHTAGIAEQADGSWHVFSSREEQARRIAAAKAANARIAAAR